MGRNRTWPVGASLNGSQGQSRWWKRPYRGNRCWHLGWRRSHVSTLPFSFVCRVQQSAMRNDKSCNVRIGRQRQVPLPFDCITTFQDLTYQGVRPPKSCCATTVLGRSDPLLHRLVVGRVDDAAVGRAPMLLLVLPKRDNCRV